MARIRYRRLWLVAAAVAGCSTGKASVSYRDGGGDVGLQFQDGLHLEQGVAPDHDGQATVDTAPPVTTITCNGDCRDMVVSRLLLPDSNTPPIDLDGDGSPDNALGSILLAFNAAMPSLTLQEDLDSSVYKGSLLMLIRLQASSFVDANQALAQVWRGAEQACCTTTGDVATCKAEAAKTCYSGNHTFKPHATAPNTSVLGGSITGAHGAFGPASMSVILSFSSMSPIQLDMIGVRLQGTLSGGGIQGGVLAGAVPKSQLDSTVIPAFATMLNDELQDPGASQTTKDTIKNLFDANKDGAISSAEVKDNALVKTFLAGDVDIDGDGVKELSLGLEFQAVSAVIDG